MKTIKFFSVFICAVMFFLSCENDSTEFQEDLTNTQQIELQGDSKSLNERTSCNYNTAILDEYIDGTQSGANIVYLFTNGNFPNGTTYEWLITRQNGLTQSYEASTDNPRAVSASSSNKIIRARVTARYQECSRTFLKTFIQPIPNGSGGFN
ncbi:hypothetical protein [Aquimarina celericrescens]|uniref:Lipoprotein n=1 Tax=Aquimarina celericrescens TaxID=1964542 RepID=A0ABW5AUS8_9FLAO|nr:hypothetical protein [Aquimarina celericrescens]